MQTEFFQTMFEENIDAHSFLNTLQQKQEIWGFH